MGDRNTSTALRYKYGRNVKCDGKHAILVENPDAYGLPKNEANTNYIIAKEDYYFVYPTNFHHYQNLYRDTMQHGGASLEEMILARRDPASQGMKNLFPAHTSSAAETRRLGRAVAEQLQAGDVVALYGNLGAGKTVFAQGLCEGLGLASEQVTKPNVLYPPRVRRRYMACVSFRRLPY